MKNSTGCDIAGMRWQKIDVSRYFASRAKLCFALGEVEKSHEGFFQQAARARAEAPPDFNNRRPANIATATRQPGAIVYADEHQVAAIPHRGYRRR
ncbi:MAG TPA: hypothetical protein VHD36_13905 [Pirellulales bacterium]|nr:hypothetical protein [Pirellulales bacterium]